MFTYQVKSFDVEMKLFGLKVTDRNDLLMVEILKLIRKQARLGSHLKQLLLEANLLMMSGILNYIQYRKSEDGYCF